MSQLGHGSTSGKMEMAFLEDTDDEDEEEEQDFDLQVDENIKNKSNEQLSREDRKENEDDAEVSGDGDNNNVFEEASGSDRGIAVPEFGDTDFSEISSIIMSGRKGLQDCSNDETYDSLLMSMNSGRKQSFAHGRQETIGGMRLNLEESTDDDDGNENDTKERDTVKQTTLITSDKDDESLSSVDYKLELKQKLLNKKKTKQKSKINNKVTNKQRWCKGW